MSLTEAIALFGVMLAMPLAFDWLHVTVTRWRGAPKDGGAA